MVFVKLFRAIHYQAGVKSPIAQSMYIPMKNIKYIEQSGNNVNIYLKSGEKIIESNRNIDDILLRKNIIYDYYNESINGEDNCEDCICNNCENRDKYTTCKCDDCYSNKEEAKFYGSNKVKEYKKDSCENFGEDN